MSGTLTRLLRPKSVVYIGGSQIAGPIRAARRAGYDGEIWVVNPVRDEIEGIACYAAIADLPSPPDAAVVGLSPERSIKAVGELRQAGAGGAVVMSSGFLELGTDAGRDLQQRLVAAAGEMALLGPNCMGLINQFSGAAVWGDDNHIERQHGPAAAIISQSGALLIGITNVEQVFPLGFAISLGNQAVTGTPELIHALLEDDRIRAIGLYVEGINDGEAFGQACRAALIKGVPVIALKGGDGADGSKISLSHTASMVVERDLWESFCTRFGIVEVSSPKALVETLKLLTVGGLPKGNRLSIVSYSGGLNGLAATRCGSLGLKLPMPTQANGAFIRDLLPETVTLSNPLDLNIPFSASDGSISMRDTKGVADAIAAFAEDVSDQIVFFIDVPRPGAGNLDRVWCDSMEALIEVRNRLGIPVSVAGILPEGLATDFRKHMQTNGVAALLGYSDTMEALAVSARIAANRARILKQNRPEPLIAGGEPQGAMMHNEAVSKAALKAFGLTTPHHIVVPIEDAANAASSLGFPVTVKVHSDTIAHKARIGGVHLNLGDSAMVTAAVVSMTETVSRAEGGHAVTHVLVESMIAGAEAELILGIKRHPSMGLALMIGKGGVHAEDLAVFETVLLPIDGPELDRALHRLGYRNHEAVLAAAHAVANYALSNAAELVTLDVNPLLITTDGQAIAADALIVLGGKVAG